MRERNLALKETISMMLVSGLLQRQTQALYSTHPCQLKRAQMFVKCLLATFVIALSTLLTRCQITLRQHSLLLNTKRKSKRNSAVDVLLVSCLITLLSNLIHGRCQLCHCCANKRYPEDPALPFVNLPDLNELNEITNGKMWLLFITCISACS
jgi:hypothetical protein